MKLLPVVALALGLLAPLTDALACSCRAVEAARVTLPAEGATGFPTRGVVRVFATAFPPALRDAIASEYRLVDAHGTAVPLTATWVGTRLDLRPRAALRPRTRYALERIFTYAPDGALVSDARRIGLLRDAAAGLRRVWFPEVHFETAAGAAPPRARTSVTLIDAQVHLYRGGGDCGPGLTLAANYVLPPDAPATDVVQFEVRGRDLAPMIAQTLPSEGSATAYVDDTLCLPDPVTLPYRPPFAARVVLIDAAGSAVGASPWTRASVDPATPPPPDWARLRRTPPRDAALDEALRQAWTAPPIVTAAAATPDGPAACPFGLETLTRRQFASVGGRSSYDDRATLLVDGARAWLTSAVGAEDHDARLLAVAPDGAVRPGGASLQGAVTASALLDGGPLLVTQTVTAPEVQQAWLRAFAPDATARWTTPILGASHQHHLAVGGGRVLVVWEDPRRHGDAPHLVWALFDARTGAPVGDSHTTAHAIDENGAPVAAWVGDRFLIAWPSPRAASAGRAVVQVATLGAGANLTVPRALDLASDGPPDLVTAGDRVAVVAAAEGSVRWALLDPSGSFARRPVVVSDGDDGDLRKPRVTARDDLFVVTWESSGSRAVWAAAIDRRGVASPSHRVSSMRPASTGVVAAGAGGSFVAAFTVDQRRLWTSALRCRTATSPGSPPRITPVATPARPPPL